jgi:hypothetical protein
MSFLDAVMARGREYPLVRIAAPATLTTRQVR